MVKEIAKMNPLVSIIIPAYNAESFLAYSVESCLNQTWPFIEIIIVDDGSTDHTLEIALSFKSRGVKVISQLNKGASAARNRGYAESEGDFVQFLDADDILFPSKIEMQINLIGTREQMTVCSGRWGLFYDSEYNASFSPNELWHSFDNSIDWLIMAWTGRKWMHPSAWLTPRKLIERAGLWEESLSLHDDGEFFCRVLLQSKGVLFCEDAISYYRKGIENSLSSVISEKAVKSHFRICQLYEHHLLSREDSWRTRRACAANYLSFFYDHFPGNRALRRIAFHSADRLGGSDIEPAGTELFYFLKGIFGWRLSKRLEKFYYGNGLNWSSIKRLI